MLLERTVTTAASLGERAVDLERFAGAQVTLSLSARVGEAGRARLLGHAGRAQPRGCARARSRATPARPQGVIFIWADTLRRDHLDALRLRASDRAHHRADGRRGRVFEDCLAQASWTKASGALADDVALSHDARRASPSTTACPARPPRWPRSTGRPDTRRSASSDPVRRQVHEPAPGLRGAARARRVPGGAAGRHQKTARAQVDRLLPWLEAHRDAPFFVLLHVRDPHSPYRPHPPYDTMWADPARARRARAASARRCEAFIKNPNMQPRGMPTREELATAGSTPRTTSRTSATGTTGPSAAMDAEIGRLRERLPRWASTAARWSPSSPTTARSSSSTAVCSTSRASTASWRTCRCSCGGPACRPGARVAATVQNIDLMPTLLELSGLRRARGRAGREPGAAVPAGQRRAPGQAAGGHRRRPRADVGDTPPPRDDGVRDHRRRLEARAPPCSGRAAAPEHELYDHRRTRWTADVRAAPGGRGPPGAELEAWRRMAAQARLKPDAALSEEHERGRPGAPARARLRAVGGAFRARRRRRHVRVGRAAPSGSGGQ